MQVVTDFENLFASLASKLVTFDYLTKLFLYQAFSALKGDVLVSEQKTDNKTPSLPLPAADLMISTRNWPTRSCAPSIGPRPRQIATTWSKSSAKPIPRSKCGLETSGRGSRGGKKGVTGFGKSKGLRDKEEFMS